MKKFNFKKNQGEAEASAAVPVVAVKKSSGGGNNASSGSRFAVAKSSSGGGNSASGGSRFSINRFKKSNNADEEQTDCPTPSPPRTKSIGGSSIGGSLKSKQSKKKSKSKPQPRQIDYDDENDEECGKSSSRRGKAPSSSSSSCCSCKRLIMSSCCVILATIIGVVTWRYGPWAKDSASVESLAATDACDGCCNGLASNCDLPINEVLFPMVHNAHSSYDNNFVGASNGRSMEEALVAGFRALRLSTCMCEGFLSKVLLERDAEWGLGDSNLGFCHTACGAGVRDPKDVLTNLKTFLDTNPREVLILEFDFKDGSSEDLRKALQYSGLLDYVYHPQDEYYIEDWPTLQQLINDNTRLLLFGSGDGMDSCPAYDCQDGILYTKDHFSQTLTDGSDLEACDATLSGDVFVGYFLMNHYEDGKLKMPSPKKARELNSYENLETRFQACEGKRRPNLLVVEFWDEGEVLDFVKNVNAGKNRDGGEFLLDTTSEEGQEEEDMPAAEEYVQT